MTFVQRHLVISVIEVSLFSNYFATLLVDTTTTNSINIIIYITDIKIYITDFINSIDTKTYITDFINSINTMIYTTNTIRYITDFTNIHIKDRNSKKYNYFTSFNIANKILIDTIYWYLG